MRPVLWLGLLGGCHLALGLEEAEEIVPPTPECALGGECDDDEPCTADSCEASLCVHTPLDMHAPEELQVAGDCRRAVCRSGVLSDVNDDADLPDDSDECRDDLCMLGAPSHPTLPGGTACTQDGGAVCNGSGECTACFSNLQCTAPETCGGGTEPWQCGCTPQTCADAGKTCGSADDGCGTLLDCDNGMDGDETDADCGGDISACPTRCAAGSMCGVPGDCASANCSGATCL